MGKDVQHKPLGGHGETLAMKHLLSKGYKVLATNYRYGRYEVDLIMQDRDEVVFIEVKTRSQMGEGEKAEESVGWVKRSRIVAVANAFLEEKALDLDARFDIITIVMGGHGYRITHIRQAFNLWEVYM
jgi:putative endonuclease